MKILIIDDNDLNRALLIDIFKLQKIECLACDGVLKAIEEYKSFKADLVLMDIRMPNIDGIEGLRIFREINKDIMVFALTANALSTQVEEYFKLGFTDVVTKPFRIRELLNKIEKVRKYDK